MDRVIHRRTSVAATGVQKPNGAASSVFDVARPTKKPRAPRVKPPAIDVAGIKVEKGVAIPPLLRKSGGRYDALFERLLPNTSAALPVAHTKGLRSASVTWQKKHPATKLVVRVVSETDVRIWRTA